MQLHEADRDEVVLIPATVVEPADGPDDAATVRVEGEPLVALAGSVEVETPRATLRQRLTDEGE